MDSKDIGSQLADFNLCKSLGGVGTDNEVNLPENVREYLLNLPFWDKEVDALWIQNPKERDNARKLGYSFVVKVKTDSSGFYLNNKKVLSWTEEYVFNKDHVIFGSTKGYFWRFAEDKIEITLTSNLETLQQIIFPNLEKLRALVEPAQQAIILETIKTFTSWEREHGVYVCHFEDNISNLFTDYLTVGTVNSNGLYVNGDLLVSWNDFIPRIEGEQFYVVQKTALANVGEDPLFLDAIRYQIGADKKTITRITLGTSVEGIVYLFGYLQQNVPLFHESKGELKERYRTLERSDDVTVKSKTLEYKEIGGFFAKEKYFANINLWARKMSSGIEVLFFLDCFSLDYSGNQVSAGEILQMGNGTLKIDLDSGRDSIVFDNVFQSSIDKDEEVLVYLIGKRLLRKIAKAKKIKIILSCRVEVTLEANQLAQIARDFDKEIFDAPQHEYDYYDAEEFWKNKDTFSAAKYIVKAIKGCPDEGYYSYRKKDFFLGVYITISDELKAIKEFVSKKQFKEANAKIKSLDTKLDEDLRSYLVNYEDANISIKEKLAEFDKLKAETKELESRDLYEKAQTSMESSNFEACERYINEALKLIQAPEYVTLKDELIAKWVPVLVQQSTSLRSSGNLGEALKCLEKAVLLMPDDTTLKKQRDDLNVEIDAKNKERGKRFLIGLGVIIALSVIVWGIIGMLKSTDDSDNDDTEDVVEEEVVNSNSEPEMVEEESEEFLGVDLAMFDLKGHVKQVEYPRDNNQPNGPALICKFDEDGKLVSGTLLELFNYHPDPIALKPQRNEEGKIVSFIESRDTFTPVFFDNGKIQTIDMCLPTMGCMSYNYSMDNYGVISSGTTEVSVHGYRSKIFSEYEYTKYDDKGNWIERKVSGTSYEYSYNEDGEEVEEKEDFSGGIETRRIIYY